MSKKNIYTMHFQYQGSPDQRINKVRHDVMSFTSMERTQYSMYNREVAWDLDGEEISFEEVRAIRYHSYVHPSIVLTEEITSPNILVGKNERSVIAESMIVENKQEEQKDQLKNSITDLAQVAETIPFVTNNKAHPRVRFSDVFEQKQERKSHSRRSILKKPPPLFDDAQCEPYPENIMDTIQSMKKDFSPESNVFSNLVSNNSLTEDRRKSILRPLRANDEKENINVNNKVPSRTLPNESVKKIHFNEEAQNKPQSSNKYKHVQEYHPNKLAAMETESKKPEALKFCAQNITPLENINAKPDQLTISEPKSVPSFSTPSAHAKIVSSSELLIPDKLPQDDTFASLEFTNLTSTSFNTGNLTFNSLEALESFKKMANKVEMSDDSCDESDISANIVTGDFLKLFQTVGNNQHDETMDGVEDNQNNNNTTTFTTGDFLNLFQKVEINNNNSSFHIDNDTTNIATGDFLKLFQTVEKQQKSSEDQDVMVVELNEDINTGLTANIATGDFLNLFQTIQTENAEQKTKLEDDITLAPENEYVDSHCMMKTEDIIRNYPYRGSLRDVTGEITVGLSSFLTASELYSTENIDDPFINALNDSLQDKNEENIKVEEFSEYKGNTETMNEVLPIFSFQECPKIADPYALSRTARMEIVDHLLPYDGSVIDYSDESAPSIQLNEYLTIGTHSFTVTKQIDENSFLLEASNMLYRLSIQSPPDPWEYYVCKQLHQRIDDSLIKSNFLAIKPYELLYISSDKSFTLEGWNKNTLTLKDIIDDCGKKNITLQSEVIAYFILGIIQIISVFHKYNFLLGKIQLKQFIVNEVMSLKCPLKISGFSQSLDLSSFPQSTLFSSNQLRFEGYTIIEPWSQEIDLIGLAEITHQMVYGKIMELQFVDGKWTTVNSLKQFREDKPLYELLFSLCLNQKVDSESILLTLDAEFRKFFSARRLLTLKNHIKKLLSQ